MDQQTLSSLAGVILSLAFSYVPKLNAWHDALDPVTKRLVMLGALLVAALVAFGASCLNLYGYVPCDMAGAKQLVNAFISAAVASQATFLLTPQGKKQQAVTDGAQG